MSEVNVVADAILNIRAHGWLENDLVLLSNALIIVGEVERLGLTITALLETLDERDDRGAVASELISDLSASLEDAELWFDNPNEQGIKPLLDRVEKYHNP